MAWPVPVEALWNDLQSVRSELLKEAAPPLPPFPQDLKAFAPVPPPPPGPAKAPEVVYPERGHPLDRLLADLKAIRERSRQSIERLAAVDPRGLRWRHFTLGEMDLAQFWLLHVRHETDHLEQLRAVKAARGFPRS